MKKVLLVALFVIMAMGLFGVTFRGRLDCNENCRIIVKLIDVETGLAVYQNVFSSVNPSYTYNFQAYIDDPDFTVGDYKWVVYAYDYTASDLQEKIARSADGPYGTISYFHMVVDPTSSPGNPSN